MAASRAPRRLIPKRRPTAAAPRDERLLLGAVALCVVARLAVIPFDRPGLWGLGSLRDVPGALAALLGAMMVLALVPPVGRAAAGALAALGRGLGAPAPLAYGVYPALAFVLLALTNDPLHAIGDTTLRISAITVRGSSNIALPQAAPLDVGVNLVLARALVDRFGVAPETSLRLVGSLVGAIWLAGVMAFARAAGRSPQTRALAFVALAATAIPLHFSGYDKFGPSLAGRAWAAAGAMRLRGERGRAGAPWALALGMGVAVLGHRSALLLAPAAVALLIADARASERRRDALLALGLMLALVAVGLPSAWQGFNVIDRTRHLSSAALRPHLGSALQLLLLVAPLWPVGVVALARRIPTPLGAAWWALVLLPPLVQIVFVVGSQGPVRDWDMHLGAGFVIAAAVAAWLCAAPSARAPSAHWPAAAAVVALASATALWTAHLGDVRQFDALERELRDRRQWSDEAWARTQDLVGALYAHAGNFPKAGEHWREAALAAPNPRYVYQVGLALVRVRSFDEGRAWMLKAHALDPAMADPFVGLAMLSSARDSLDDAERWADSALVRQPGKWDALQLKDAIAKARAVAR